MDNSENYEVKDISLAEQGLKNIEWAEQEMGALLAIKKRFEVEKPFEGLRIGMALHVTKETAVLVKTLEAGGADVSIASCNPLSTQDDIAAALAKEGIKVFAYKGETKEDYYKFIKNVIATKPQITIDDGCDLVSEIHQNHAELIPDLIGGCEETTTGIVRLNAMEKDNALKYPIVAVNDNETKHLFDNFYGTGQSALDGVLRASNIILAGKAVVVIGYGDCGRGVSLRAKGLGSEVIVTEVNPVRALQARMDGYRVMPMNEAAPLGDLFVTVTGNKHVISVDHMKLMHDGAVFCNAGHFDNEIDVTGLEEVAQSKRTIRPLFDEYVLDGKKIYLAGEGRLVNLACAEGHPSAVMSTSFCGQALACEYLVKKKGELKPGVVLLPEELDQEISRLQLDTMGITFDVLTEEQIKYLGSWTEGT